MKQAWKKNFLEWELGLSIAISVGFAIWVEGLHGLHDVDVILNGQRAAVYGTTASIAGALLGFIIATVAIILGFSAGDSFTVLRESAYYKDLWRTLKSTIKMLALATLAAVVALLVDRDAAPNAPAMLVCFGFAVLSIIRLARSIWILNKVMFIVTGVSQ